MKKKFYIVISAILIFALFCILAFTVTGSTDMFLAGELLGESRAAKETDTEIVAKYKEHEILASAVSYTKKMNFMRDAQTAKEYATDRDVIDKLIKNMILLEEAEARGLGATEAEIEEMVAATKTAYELPDGKEILDEYCKGAGITIDEYFDIIREQAPRTIARQKLKDAIGREYCEANNIEFTKTNPPPEIATAVDELIDKLFKENKDNITYYID